jgi:hypothetical protein
MIPMVNTHIQTNKSMKPIEEDNFRVQKCIKMLRIRFCKGFV